MPRRLKKLHITRVDRVDDPANPDARIVLFKSAIFDKATKREDGQDFPPQAFAYVPDPESPSTWKLRLWDDLSQRETAAQVGRAVAALGPAGFRGNRVQLPDADRPQVVAKIRAAWRRVNDPDRDLPDVLKAHDDLKGVTMPDEPTNTLNLDDADAVTAFLEGMMALRDEQPAAPEVTDEAIAEAIAEMDTEQLVAASKGRVAPVVEDDTEPTVEDILKAADPRVAELIRKGQENEVRIAKMEAAARLDGFVAVAKSDMPSLSETADEIGRLLADVATALGSDDHELVKTLTRVLKAASAQAEKADDVLMKSSGSNPVSADSAQGEIERRAADLAKSKGISMAQATRDVLTADPALLTRHLAGE